MKLNFDFRPFLVRLRSVLLCMCTLFAASCNNPGSAIPMVEYLAARNLQNHLIITGDYQPNPPGSVSGEANMNVSRYWNYRVRLREQFISYGTGTGDCIPADRIQKTFGPQKEMAGIWSDGTLKLGWYIGVLATEIHMLRHPSIYPGFGDSTDLHNAKAELYCALTAFERLDRFGEQKIWEYTAQGGLKLLGSKGFHWPDSPGFFIRDDVAAATGRALGLDSLRSDYAVIDDLARPAQTTHPTLPFNKEMSQDQAIHMLLGLALARRLLPPNTTYKGVSLRDYAVNEARKIMDWVGRGSEWIIRDPVTPVIRHYGPIPWFDPWHPADWDHLSPVRRGPDARPFSYGFSRAEKFIDGRQQGVSPSARALWLALQAGAPAFQLIASLRNAQADNLHMIMALAAVGDSWGSSTGLSLQQLASYEDFLLYPILNQVLHYSPGSLDGQLINDARNLLQSAPYAGPSIGGPAWAVNSHGWGSDNRFIRERKQQNQKGAAALLESFNGLDYMLLHNLFYIAAPHYFQSVQFRSHSRIPDLSPPGWPVPAAAEIPPLGYVSFGTPRTIDRGESTEAMQVDIFLHYTDPDGDTDRVAVGHDLPGEGIVRKIGSQFEFTGPVYGAAKHRTSFTIYLQDEQGQRNEIDVPLEWNGRINHPPRVGAVIYLDRIVVGGTALGVPAWGTAEWNMTVYVVDPDYPMPEPGPFLITGMENLVAFPTSANTVKIITAWSLLQPHGAGTVTIRGFDTLGTSTEKEFTVQW